MWRTVCLLICWLLTAFLACTHGEEPEPEPIAPPCATYSVDITSMVNSKCAVSGCHVSGFTFGNFTLYDELKKRVDNGKIQLLVFDNQLMPPATAQQLTEEERTKLKCWMDDGALNN